MTALNFIMEIGGTSGSNLNIMLLVFVFLLIEHLKG